MICRFRPAPSKVKICTAASASVCTTSWASASSIAVIDLAEASFAEVRAIAATRRCRCRSAVTSRNATTVACSGPGSGRAR
jgi:hypothetical protein